MPSACQSLIQDRVEQVNPFVGVGLRQAKKLALHCLCRILFEVHQNKQQFVFDRWKRAIAIRRIGPPDAVKALNRLCCEGLLKAGRKGGDEMLKLSTGQAGQGYKLRLVFGDVQVTEHSTSF